MQTLLMLATFVCLQDAAAPEPSPQRSDIGIRVTMLALDSTISVPEEIADPKKYVSDLRPEKGVQWSERFVLSTLENTEVRVQRGTEQGVATGYSVSPPSGFSSRTRERPATAPPVSNETPGRNTPPRFGVPSSSLGGQLTPQIAMQRTGTQIALKPAIRPHRRVVVDATIESTRLDESSDETDADALIPRSCIRKLMVNTTVSVAPGKAVLLQASETDVGGMLPDQTVLILIEAEILQ